MFFFGWYKRGGGREKKGIPYNFAGCGIIRVNTMLVRVLDLLLSFDVNLALGWIAGKSGLLRG